MPLDSGSDDERKLAKLAAAGADTPLAAIGSGSDYSSFHENPGIAAMNVRFGGEADRSGICHSSYDSYDHHARFGDADERYGAVLAKTAGRLALRTANADVVPMRFGDTAATYAGYLAELKQMLVTRRERGPKVAALPAADGFRIATNPLHPLAASVPTSTVQPLDCGPLERAIGRIEVGSARYDAARTRVGLALDA